MEIVKCCATCENATYSQKKGKTVTCDIDSQIYSQYGEPCNMYISDVDRIERILNYVRLAR